MRHDNEVLTDNTKIDFCRQCKHCAFWDGGTLYSNAYDKSSCAMYPYPDKKPSDVIMNRGECVYRMEKPR